MKNLLIRFIIFCSIFCYSQEKFDGIVRYKQTNNLDVKINLYFDLYFNNKMSLFIEQNVLKTGTKLVKESIEDGYINKVYGERKNLKPMFYLNQRDNFIFMENQYDECLYVRDNNIVLSWKIFNDTKKIGSFICRKATTFFRGRNYIAWYAPEIPVRWGPHKFSGLNGLVLEIYDENNIYSFVAEKVVFGSDKNEINIFLPTLPKQILSQAEFKIKKLKLTKAFFALLSSQQPKGSEPIVLDEDCEDCNSQSMEIEPKK